MLKHFLLGMAALVLFLLPVPLEAQIAPGGRLLVTVADSTGAVIPGATVTVTGLEDATKAAAAAPLKTSERGVATIERLVPGRYSIQAEFTGFASGILKDARVRTGENRQTIVLRLKTLEESVTVAQDAQIVAANPRGGAFATALTREQIDALSDDPTELLQQLQDMAGGNATIRIDSFIGGALPPKSQIRSIHIARDAFNAENHSAETEEIDIVTQPGAGPVHGGGTSRWRDGSLSSRSPFTATKGPERTQNYDGNIGGSIVPNKSGFSISGASRRSFDTPNLNVSLPSGTVSEVLNLRRPNDNWSVRGLVDYALTQDHTLRMSYDQSVSDRRNLGVGAYDLAQRAYGTNAKDYEFRIQEVGPIGRRFFGNTRLQIQRSDSTSRSSLEAPTIRVLDAFTGGGAQVAGGRHQTGIEAASDIDYIRGIHSVRTGVLIDSNRFRTDDATNYLGTYTFTSNADYAAGIPATYTRRIGNPLIEYWSTQAAAYAQDDMRLRKNFTLSAGVRYEVQNHLPGLGNAGPRLGASWAPFKSGKTTLRGSWGVFYNWVGSGTYEQTLRVDGFRQEELNIVNPSYPDPGVTGTVSATNRYLLGEDPRMSRTIRFSAGIDQTLTPRVRFNATYSDARGSRLLRGTNLNAPVVGVRPDPAFANVIEIVPDASSRTKQLATTINLNLAPSGRATSQPLFNWRRTTVRFSYWIATAENNTDGAFNVPPSGSLSTEWGPTSGDRRHRISGSLTSQALKNLSATLSVAANTGTPYTITTGVDDNGDLIFNDRPFGVDRNSVRTPTQCTWSANASYSIGFGSGPAAAVQQGRDGAPAPAPVGGRYQLGFTVSLNNLTNRPNYTGFSGNMKSLFFEQATAVSNPRKIDIGMNFRF